MLALWCEVDGRMGRMARLLSIDLVRAALAASVRCFECLERCLLTLYPIDCLGVGLWFFFATL